MNEGAFLCEQRPDLITPVKIEHLLDEFIHEGSASPATTTSTTSSRTPIASCEAASISTMQAR